MAKPKWDEWEAARRPFISLLIIKWWWQIILHWNNFRLSFVFFLLFFFNHNSHLFIFDRASAQRFDVAPFPVCWRWFFFSFLACIQEFHHMSIKFLKKAYVTLFCGLIMGKKQKWAFSLRLATFFQTRHQISMNTKWWTKNLWVDLWKVTWGQMSTQGFFLTLVGWGQRTARMASSNTVFRPRWLSAEHSKYLMASAAKHQGQLEIWVSRGRVSSPSEVNSGGFGAFKLGSLIWVSSAGLGFTLGF